MKKRVFVISLMVMLAGFLAASVVPAVRAEEKSASISYQTHVQNIGWQDWQADGQMAGTTGRALRLEGIKINLDLNGYEGGVEYQTHVQNIGWQSKVENGEMSGTSGQALRLEAIRINLTGEVADEYSVCYRVHAQNFGWLGWACDGGSAGTATYGYRLEGIEVKMVKKTDLGNMRVGGAYQTRMLKYRTYVQNVGWQDWKKNGEMAGTSGQALRLEGIEIKLVPTDRCGIGSIYPIDDGGENEGENQGGENNENEEAKLVHFTEEAPILEVNSETSGFYDYGVIAKYADENLYVDGFEVEIFEGGELYSPWNVASGSTRVMWDADNIGLVNECSYDWKLNDSNDGYGKQEIKARSYGVVNGEKNYSEYSNSLFVEYNKLNINLDGGELPDMSWPYKEDGAMLVGAGRTNYIYGQKYKLMTPNKYGHKFVGWTGDNGSEPQKDVYITEDATGELNYVANWEEMPEEYYLTLDTPKLVRVELPDDGKAGTETDYRLKMYYDDTEYYVSGFEVYKAYAEDGDYDLIGVMTYGESEHDYYDESGRRYMSDAEMNRSLTMEMADREMYYKVRAFKMVGDEKKYSHFSDVLKIESGIVELDLDGGTLPEYVTADGVPNIHNGVGYIYEREVGNYVLGKMYVYDQEYRLAEPQKEGYTFMGWTGSNGEVPQKNIKIETGARGIISYRANWAEGEPELEVAKPTIVWKDAATFAVRVQIGYENYGDYANGFELGYSGSSEGEFAEYGEWCSVSPYSSGRYGSLIMECTLLPREIGSDVYLVARGYKNIEDAKIYSEWSEPVLVRVQAIEFDLNGGSEDGMGMGYGTVDEEPFAIIEPTAKGYIIGKRYKVVQPVREGYTFVGWTGSNGEVPKVDVYIEAGTDEPLHYKANWVKNS